MAIFSPPLAFPKLPGLQRRFKMAWSLAAPCCSCSDSLAPQVVLYEPLWYNSGFWWFLQPSNQRNINQNEYWIILNYIELCIAMGTSLPVRVSAMEHPLSSTDSALRAVVSLGSSRSLWILYFCSSQIFHAIIFTHFQLAYVSLQSQGPTCSMNVQHTADMTWITPTCGAGKYRQDWWRSVNSDSFKGNWCQFQRFIKLYY